MQTAFSTPLRAPAQILRESKGSLPMDLFGHLPTDRRGRRVALLGRGKQMRCNNVQIQ
jgi:hypothetical protein